MLDEVGFIFYGTDDNVYLMRMYYGHPWIFYYSNKEWVTLKQVGQMEVWQANEREVTDVNVLAYYGR